MGNRETGTKKTIRYLALGNTSKIATKGGGPRKRTGWAKTTDTSVFGEKVKRQISHQKHLEGTRHLGVTVCSSFPGGHILRPPVLALPSMSSALPCLYEGFATTSNALQDTNEIPSTAVQVNHGDELGSKKAPDKISNLAEMHNNKSEMGGRLAKGTKAGN